MKALDEIEWGKFLIEDLFTVYIGQNIDGNKVDKKNGKIAYITRKENNNALDGFVDADESLLNKEYPVITIGNETAEPFVQTYYFFTGTKVNILKPKENISKYTLLFIVPCLKMHKSKYSYSYTINSTRLKKQVILLPITEKGEPDYAYMEAYMREKEKALIERQKRNILKSLNEQGKIEVKRFDEIKWKEFKIGDLFTLKQGKSKGLNHLKESNNGINYLGATNLNNAVLCQVEKVNSYVQRGNCIAFIRNGEGSMGYSVYKAEDFIATSDISVGYNDNLNRYVGTFITTLADRVRGKYKFSYKRSATRLAKESLMLPTDAFGEPDYAYMEAYMRCHEQSILRQYLGYIEKK